MLLMLCACGIVALICFAWADGYRAGQKAERKRHLAAIRPVLYKTTLVIDSSSVHTPDSLREQAEKN